jgi:hypothetical protein
MAERSERRVVRTRLPSTWGTHPDALDETVVHDPSGRPWLIYTTDRLYQLEPRRPSASTEPLGESDLGDEGEIRQSHETRYETQVFYTARAGIRGFPTGHGQRYGERDAAITGHRYWCLLVRTGDVQPDRTPDDPLDG